MTQSVSQIRHDIENTKAHISQTVNELEERFQEMKDWRTVISEYPLVSIGVSIGAGFLLSGAITGRIFGVVGKNLVQIATGTLTGVVMQQLQDKANGNKHVIVDEEKVLVSEDTVVIGC